MFYYEVFFHDIIMAKFRFKLDAERFISSFAPDHRCFFYLKQKRMTKLRGF